MLCNGAGLESEARTGLDRCPDQSLSGRTQEASFECGFGAAADSAPLNQGLGELNCGRLAWRGEACAPSRPPTPNDRIGWPGSGFGEEW
jgi:hypothetical protein